MSILKFGMSIVSGSEVNTDMLIWKVCKDEMGYNDTVCEDLSTDEQWEDAEAEGSLISLTAKSDPD